MSELARALGCESIKICGVTWPALRKAGRLEGTVKLAAGRVV